MEESSNPAKGDLVLDCECDEGMRPFARELILEGYRCKCKVYYREKSKTKETGSEIQLGVVTLEAKKFRE